MKVLDEIFLNESLLLTEVLENRMLACFEKYSIGASVRRKAAPMQSLKDPKNIGKYCK